ncbi:hypothetical protein FB451DRAFT_1452611 [Mycena latifolia]|nr:hypothetical protein FB451DRAFT_1452611 [Mycena latifolia]
MVALVQDLIDTIIDELAGTKWLRRDDYANLRACSLTARAFVAPSQRHLFRSLTLTGYRGELEGRWRILGNSSHLTSYIRDLRVHFSLDSASSLAALLPRFTRVHRVAITSPDNWDAFPITFRTALFSLLSLPSLRCVALDRCVGFPPSFIRHVLMSYKEVSLKRVSIGSDSDEELFPSGQTAEKPLPSAAPLDHLALEYRPEESAPLHALIFDDRISGCLGHLRQLDLPLALPGSLGAFEDIALKFSSSIEHLVINFHKWHDDPIILPNLPRLRVLTLKAAVRKLRVPSSLLVGIASLPTCMPAIEVVKVLIHAGFEEPWDDHHRPDVDQALKNLPNLMEVVER